MDAGKLRWGYVVSDFAFSALAWGIISVFRFHEVACRQGFATLGSFLSDNMVLAGLFLVPVVWLFLFYLSGYYNRPLGKSRFDELECTAISVLSGTVLFFFLLILNDVPESFRSYYKLFFVMMGVQFALVYTGRVCITSAAIRIRRKGGWRLRVLVIGTDAVAGNTGSELCALGYDVLGYVDPETGTGTPVAGLHVLGGLSELPRLSQRYPFDELVVAADIPDAAKLTEIIYLLYRYNCPVKMREVKNNVLSKVKVNTIYDVPLADITGNNFSDWEQNMKFVSDKVVAAVLLVLLSPLFLYISWRIRRGSEGAALFRQERIGYKGKPFTIYKFRTMYADAEEGGPALSNRQDERITPFGAFLRKYRLDELPQFWNVLKGDMSFVGPRPERKYYIDKIVEKAPYYCLLHNVRPGITSLGMVKYGYAGNVDEMLARLEYDMIYYENMSLKLDLMILLDTVRTVATGKGI